MEDNPEIERAITFPDGNIYSLPNIAAEDFTSLRVGAMPWINTDWLEALDMDMPETTDEFYEYLKGVKEEDVSGTGQNDEIPYGGTQINHLIQWLQGAFGINNRGDGMFDIAEDGNLRFIPTADGYKEMLEYLHKLYDEELIEQNIFFQLSMRSIWRIARLSDTVAPFFGLPKNSKGRMIQQVH